MQRPQEIARAVTHVQKEQNEQNERKENRMLFESRMDARHHITIQRG